MQLVKVQRIQDNCEILRTVFHLSLRCVWLSIQHLKLRTWRSQFRPCPLHCFFRQGILLHFCLSSPWCIYGYWQHSAVRGGGVNPAILSRRGGVAILLSMLHATETEISSCRLGLWLACTLPFTQGHTYCQYQLTRRKLYWTMLFETSFLISSSSYHNNKN